MSSVSQDRRTCRVIQSFGTPAHPPEPSVEQDLAFVLPSCLTSFRLTRNRVRWKATPGTTWVPEGEANREADPGATGKAMGKALRKATLEATGKATRRARWEAEGQAGREARGRARGEATGKASREAEPKAGWEAIGKALRDAVFTAPGDACGNRHSLPGSVLHQSTDWVSRLPRSLIHLRFATRRPAERRAGY
jgi:hypothetical protein